MSQAATQPARTDTPPVAPAPLLELRDLTISFDNKGGPRLLAVDGACMSLFPSQTLAVVGESGCGKSITAMSVLGLVPSPPGRVDEGQILFQRPSDAPGAPTDLLSLDEAALRRVRGGEIAMIFQEPMTSLNPVYSIGEQMIETIRLHQGVGEKEARRIAAEALAEVGITDPEKRLRAFPHEFSGGMRQRVMIAMALACEPSVILADEPTTALDVTIQAQILDLLKQIQRERGVGVLLITHDLGVVAQNADVVCVMYAGRVVEYARVRELFSNPTHPYTKGLLASIPLMRERRDRLSTIREVVGEAPRFEGAHAESLREAVPWWPWNEAPVGTTPTNGPAADSALVEAAPGHWVAAWRTGGALALGGPKTPSLPPL